MDYNLAYIPPRFNVPRREDFDTEYMRRLFEVVAGLPWLAVAATQVPLAGILRKLASALL